MKYLAGAIPFSPKIGIIPIIPALLEPSNFLRINLCSIPNIFATSLLSIVNSLLLFKTVNLFIIYQPSFYNIIFMVYFNFYKAVTNTQSYQQNIKFRKVDIDVYISNLSYIYHIYME